MVGRSSPLAELGRRPQAVSRTTRVHERRRGGARRRGQFVTRRGRRRRRRAFVAEPRRRGRRALRSRRGPRVAGLRRARGRRPRDALHRGRKGPVFVTMARGLDEPTRARVAAARRSSERQVAGGVERRGVGHAYPRPRRNLSRLESHVGRPRNIHVVAAAPPRPGSARRPPRNNRYAYHDGRRAARTRSGHLAEHGRAPGRVPPVRRDEPRRVSSAPLGSVRQEMARVARRGGGGSRGRPRRPGAAAA